MYKAILGGRAADGRITDQIIELRTPWLDGPGNFVVKLRFDDSCGNGHESFAATCSYDLGNAGGANHEEIVRHFPELEPFMKWHLVSTDGPMHYLSNVLFLAGDHDCWGRAPGEPYAFKPFLFVSDSPIGVPLPERFAAWLREHWDEKHFSEPVPCTGEYDPKVTLKGYDCSWANAPFDTGRDASDFIAALELPCEIKERPTMWSTGKERELDAARRAACWPEAIDEVLTLDRGSLEHLLMTRLPSLIAAFREAMVTLGFTYPEARDV